MSNYDTYFEYTKAANIKMPKILAQTLDNSQENISTLDFSQQLKTDYRATSPSCLVSFINLKANESININANAGSHVFLVMSGSGISKQNETEFKWSNGDVFTFSLDDEITHQCFEDSILYYVNDEPLFNFLGAKPFKKTFTSTHYPFKTILQKVESFNNENGATKRNRNGVILANKDSPISKTLTPTLWCLYNVLPKNTVQLPHQHNSVALDLCVTAPKFGCYTLMSEKIDKNGNLINPIRMDWESNGAFVTPPGWWHSHHNETNEDAVVFPVQDAGLHTYLRTLFINFVVSKKSIQ